MKTINVKAEDIADVLDSILYNDDEGYEEALEMGYEAIEMLSEAIRDSGDTFTITQYGKGE